MLSFTTYLTFAMTTGLKHILEMHPRIYNIMLIGNLQNISLREWFICWLFQLFWIKHGKPYFINSSKLGSSVILVEYLKHRLQRLHACISGIMLNPYAQTTMPLHWELVAWSVMSNAKIVMLEGFWEIRILWKKKFIHEMNSTMLTFKNACPAKYMNITSKNKKDF